MCHLKKKIVLLNTQMAHRFQKLRWWGTIFLVKLDNLKECIFIAT